MDGYLQFSAGGLVHVGRELVDVLGVEVAGRVAGRHVPLLLGGDRGGQHEQSGSGSGGGESFKHGGLLEWGGRKGDVVDTFQ